MAMLETGETNLNSVFGSYELHGECLQTFLREFVDAKEAPGFHGPKKYLNGLQRIANGESNVLEVSADDIQQFFPPKEGSKSAGVCDGIIYNTRRYLSLLYSAAEVVKNEYAPAAADSAAQSAPLAAEMQQANVPVQLRASYEIHIRPPSADPVLPVRLIRAAHVGSLVKVEAVVTKVSSVRPKIQVAAYKCHDCGANLFQAVDGPAYMPLAECSASSCIKNVAKGELRLAIRESKFVKCQEVRVQEPPHHVPQGSIPRWMKIVLDGELCRTLTPGMSVTLGGVLLPIAKTGFAALRAGLVADTFFEVHSVDVKKRGYGEELELSNDEADALLRRYHNSPELYEKLAYSIGPAICGHSDVKKSLLLQLVGGVTENFQDGMKIRGDIHVLLMGDPGVAKSQLLRQVCKIAPRAHYTTGKGSSGVGLTASVTKDAVTGEFTLEGGAIVLSDNGICCIDEFDKMEESDRTAIHEVMEQQTVSVAKAGLTTTLNARTSILAAANPVFGRYDIRKSPVANMNLPAALLSRFDIQYVMLDRPDITKDTELAKHVLYVHRHSKPPQLDDTESFDAKTMRMFIAKARQYDPKLPMTLVQEIVEHYVDLRSHERQERERDEFRSYTTPRTLLGILRMSQALARLRHSDQVDRGDFEEALRLMQESKKSVLATEEDHKASQRSDFRSDIVEILKDLDTRQGRRRKWDGWLALTAVEDQVLRMGYTRAQMLTTIDEYVDLDVLVWKSESRGMLAFAERLEQRMDENFEDEDDEETEN